MRKLNFLLLLLIARQQIHAQSFYQEYHEPFPLDISANANTNGSTNSSTNSSKNVRSIAISADDDIYIATETGVYRKPKGSATWTALPFSDVDAGPAYAVAIAQDSALWIGNWKGLFQWKNGQLRSVTGPDGPISVLCPEGEGGYAAGPNGIWRYNGQTAIKQAYPVARSVRYAIPEREGGLWIASDVGLYHVTKEGTNYYYKTDLLISAALKGLATDAQGNLWAAGLGGVSIINEYSSIHNKNIGEKNIGKKSTNIKSINIKNIGIIDKGSATTHQNIATFNQNISIKKQLRPADGLPSVFVNCVKRSPDNSMWVGTKTGIARFNPDGTHSLRFSRRWLLADQVNDIAFDHEGNAWIATAGGVSAIKKKRMTLAEKQHYYYGVLMRRHIREPWIAGQCHLPVAGDTTRWQPEDDDNDGEYTGNYLAMESFRYAATNDPDAKEKAKKAFHFLKLEQDITGGDGYFARTIVPIQWKDSVHDSNRTYDARQLAEEQVDDPRFKPVSIRWHPSADGKWLWKGDASSDEWCGHMMGYFFYYELAADEAERAQLRQHVAKLVDHLIAHRFDMMDVDGTHTRWGVWSPELLNHDPDWMPDRAENSMELLAFLKLAYYMTHDEQYQQHYLTLIHKEHYLENMAAIPAQNPAWFIYFDVTMQAYLYPILLHCEKDPKLKAFYENHLDAFMARRKADHNPLINFLYCYAGSKRIEQQTSLDFLKDTPLDLVDWHIDHTIREDVQLVRTPMLDQIQVSRLQPPSTRATVRWDANPWEAVSGSPYTEKEPVFWLLPYWIGRYLKMIPQ